MLYKYTYLYLSFNTLRRHIKLQSYEQTQPKTNTSLLSLIIYEHTTRSGSSLPTGLRSGPHVAQVMAQGPKFRILLPRSLQPNRHLAVSFVSVNIHCLFYVQNCSDDWVKFRIMPRGAQDEIQNSASLMLCAQTQRTAQWSRRLMILKTLTPHGRTDISSFMRK